MSPDVKFEQFAFSVQGRSSVKHIFNLRRTFNKGQSLLENVNFNKNTFSAIASFNQELEINLLPLPKLEYPAFTIFHLKEIDDNRWMICRIQDIIDTQNIIRSIPFVGSFYESFARPLTGAALVALGSFSGGSRSQIAYKTEARITNGENCNDPHDNFLACTEQCKNSLEIAGRQAAARLDGSDTGNGKHESFELQEK